MDRAEIMEHLGEMLTHGFDNLVPVAPSRRAWSGKLMRFAKDYIQNGSHGTQAERVEAMLTVRRKAFQKITGLDPDTPEGDHYMTNHWQPDMEASE